MLLSMVPFVILQLPKILNSSFGTRVTVLVTLLVTLSFLLASSIYQIFQPWIQNRRFEYLMNKFVRDKFVGLFSSNGGTYMPLIQEKTTASYRELEARKSRVNDLEKLYMDMALQKELQKKGRKRELREDEIVQPTSKPVYKWRPERKR